MSIVMTALAGAVAREAVTRSIDRMLPPRSTTAIDLFEDTVEFETGGAIGAILSEPQWQLISHAVQGPEVSRLVQTLVLSEASDIDTKVRKDLLERARRGFTAYLASALDSAGQPELANLADLLWERILEFVKRVSPVALTRLVKTIDTDPAEATRPQNVLLKSKRANFSPLLDDVLELIGDPRRLNNCRENAEILAEAIHADSSHIRLGHLVDEEVRADRREIYVDRSLVRRESAEHTIPTSSLPFGPRNSGRAVILGDPGVGKTTLVEHLVWTGSALSDEPHVPILITLRTYVESDSPDLLAWTAQQFTQDFSLTIHRNDILDLVRIGRASIIFDGVDEIRDVTTRAQVVRRIEAFARTYPLCNVLVTSRRVGYERARFNDAFDVYFLEEFTASQVQTYANAWFAAQSEAANAQLFMNDSVTVADIRTNPLMLSLLCGIYRAQGYIPRNRLQVYEWCADLMFTRWDSMRHVDQPLDHRQYGHRLFQELAWFFQRTQSARAGVEEGQLVKVFANFFERNAGVHPGASKRRASEFLDFCADRAWLLSSLGRNDRDQRIFAFTHRTFLEYYSAIAIVRRARSTSEIATAVLDAFREDPSSVLCDVLLQCADDKQEDGAAEVLIELLDNIPTQAQEAEAMLALVARLANAVALPNHVASKLIKAIRRVWERIAPPETYKSTRAIFELHRDARTKILTEAATDPNGWLARGLTLRWTMFRIEPDARAIEPGWREEMAALSTTVAEGPQPEEGDPSWAVTLSVASSTRTANLPVYSGLFRFLVVVEGFQAMASGPLVGTLYSQEGYLLDYLARGGPLRSTIAGSEPLVISAEDADLLSRALSAWEVERVMPSAVRSLLWWMACVMFEGAGGVASGHDRIFAQDVDTELMLSVLAKRARATGVSTGNTRLARSGKRPKISSVGLPWLLAWSRGQIDLVKIDEDDFVSDTVAESEEHAVVASKRSWLDEIPRPPAWDDMEHPLDRRR